MNLLKGANLIAFGNRRVSWIMHELENEIQPNFAIFDGESDRIHNRKPSPGEEEEVYNDEIGPGGCVHAVVIRNTVKDRTVTLINVQNGPALEAISTVLTDDGMLAAVFKRIGWGDSVLPSNFEILFKAKLRQNEEPQRDVIPEVVGSRGGSERTKTA